jgi:hypothetical protein
MFLSEGLFTSVYTATDRLCGLVVRVLGYRSGGPDSISGTTKGKKGVGLERGPLSLVSTTEELLDRKVAVGRYSSLADTDHGVFVYSYVSCLLSLICFISLYLHLIEQCFVALN